MSIYISISCLFRDKELLNTIRTAKDNAFESDDIHIGILFIGDLDFKNEIDSYIDHFKYKNIKTKFVEFEDAVGVYAGRKLAAEMYDGQDYFLQIDAHTFFLQNWDVDLVFRYKKALKITKNKKTVITAVPGAYGYEQSVPDFIKNNNSLFLIKRIGSVWYWQDTGYSHFMENEWWLPNEKSIPKFTDLPVKKVNKKIFKSVKRTGFAPAVKICAAFCFGNKYFAENTGVEPGTFFWEEEVIQTINLIANGFSLAHVGFLGPLTHHYKDATSSSSDRISLMSDLIKAEVLVPLMKNKYNEYYSDLNNKSKIELYKNYSGVDFLKGPSSNKDFPKKYINSNKFLR